MSVLSKYFLKDTSANACTPTADDYDLSGVQGSEEVVKIGPCTSETWIEIGCFAMSGEMLADGDVPYSIDIATIPSGYEVRFRLMELDNSCCPTGSNTAYSATYTTAGIKTGTWSSYNPGWGVNTHCCLQFECRRVSGHANQDVEINGNDADSYVEIQTDMPEVNVNDSVVINPKYM